MSSHEFEAFKNSALATDFTEVLEREWAPLQIVRGELWLTVADKIRHLKAGDTFTLEKSVPHIERYGAKRATFWVARVN